MPTAGSAVRFGEVVKHLVNCGRSDGVDGRRQSRFADCRPASRAKEAAIVFGAGNAQGEVRERTAPVGETMGSYLWQAEGIATRTRARILFEMPL